LAGSADEFAHALDQVVKQAVGINTATALAQAVAEARAELQRAAIGDTDNAPTTEHRAPADVVAPAPRAADVQTALTVPGIKRKPTPRPDEE
jgi:hypothetical protein